MAERGVGRQIDGILNVRYTGCSLDERIGGWCPDTAVQPATSYVVAALSVGRGSQRFPSVQTRAALIREGLISTRRN
jgi:hypothetical protein